MIELLIINKTPDEIAQGVKTGKIHLVCMAQKSLTSLIEYAEVYLRLPKNMVNECVDIVNMSKETGTLYPKAYITILPKSEFENNIPPPLTINELKKCLEDVFKANEEYLKSEIILFCIESFYVDIFSAKIIIDRLIKEYSLKNTFVKAVWMC